MKNIKMNDVKIVGNIDKHLIQMVSFAINQCMKKDWFNDYYISYDELSKYFKRIGKGCNGVVFAVNNDIALKIFISKKWSDDARSLEILNNSPYFPKLYAYHNNFMIMERINGINVKEYQENHESRTFKISSNFYNFFCESIKYARRMGLIANDLHSDNIMIRKDNGLPIIVDTGTFGLIDKNYIKEWERLSDKKWSIYEDYEVKKGINMMKEFLEETTLTFV